MLLAIDVGNTNIVFGLYDGDELQSVARIDTAVQDYKEADLDWSFVDAVIIGSVVPDVDASLAAFCKTELGVEPLFVTKDIVDIGLHFDKPDEVGADRLINAYAVKSFYKSPAIVIDFGTATTFDVIDADLCYAGGVIAPGINLSITALEAAAAKLPHIEIAKPDNVIGRSTVEAMQSGVFYGYVAMIEGMVERIAKEMGAHSPNRPFVLATGGLATLFADHTDAIEAVDDALTLKGLLEIYKKNNF